LGREEALVDLGIPVADTPEPPIETEIPPVEEIVRAFAPYAREVLGPRPAL
jgi:hypothetical protein